MQWDDERLAVSVLTSKAHRNYARDLFQMLRERRLFKLVFHRKLRDFQPLLRDALATDIQPYQAAIEGVAARELELDPNLVIAHSYRIRSVREQSRNSEGLVYVMRSDQTPIPFEEESTLFRSIDEAQKDEYLDVYAPIEFKDSGTKDRELRELDGCIRHAIEQEVNKVIDRGEKR